MEKSEYFDDGKNFFKEVAVNCKVFKEVKYW